MKKYLAILCLSAIWISTLGADCNSPNSRQVEAARQEQLSAESNRQVGMPNITNFQEKKLVKTIFELRDKSDVINNVYIQSQYTGRLIYIGRCLGYPLPYSTQFTNPEVIGYSSSNGVTTLPQADPNGLFMPSSAAATWVMMLNSKNEPKVCYFECDIIVSSLDIRLDQ